MTKESVTTEFERIRRPDRVSFHLTAEQYDKLASRRDDPHIGSMLDALRNCYDEDSAREIMVHTFFGMSRAAEYYRKLAVDALACTANSPMILAENIKVRCPKCGN
jgi:hypothetical protein